jgi:predicted Zn-dependent protease with MMP-like domain
MNKNYVALKNYPHVTANLPDLALLSRYAQDSIEGLPENFKALACNLTVKVENFADQETLTSLNIKDKYDLLGLYRGVPVPVKALQPNLTLPDVIFLYRCPLIRYSRENNESLEVLVHHVMLHEMGHHFGYTDFEMGWFK